MAAHCLPRGDSPVDRGGEASEAVLFLTTVSGDCSGEELADANAALIDSHPLESDHRCTDSCDVEATSAIVHSAPRRMLRLARTAISVGAAAAFIVVALYARRSAALLPSKARQFVELMSVLDGFKLDVLESSMNTYTGQFGGGDPFIFKCPLPSLTSRLSAEIASSMPKAVGDHLGNSDTDRQDLKSCCAEYDASGFPYQFPQCSANQSLCPSCWYRSSSSDRLASSSIINLVGVAWATSSAVSSKAKVQEAGIGSTLLNWVESGIGVEDAKGVEHAALKTKHMMASLGVGLQESDANLCPRISDWQEHMLNDDIDNIHARVYKSRSKKIAVVVFRGTQMASLKNWAVDADVERISVKLGPGGPTTLVHEGFYTALQRVMPRLRKWVEGYIAGIFGSVPRSWRLIFTGHSLGGAMALVAASLAEAQDWDRKPDATITFGAPRVADPVLNSWWEQQGLCRKLLRVNVYNDIIHWMPSEVVAGVVGEAIQAVGCVSNIEACLFGKSSSTFQTESATAGGWAHVCPDSEIIVPGAMKGVNPSASDFSLFGAALSHFEANCLYGYGYGVLYGPFASLDQYCGISPGLCLAHSPESPQDVTPAPVLASVLSG